MKNKKITLFTYKKLITNQHNLSLLFFIIFDNIIIEVMILNNTASKKDLFYMVVLILTLVAVIIGATFAAYYFLHRQEEGSSNVYTGTLSIEYLSGTIIHGYSLTPTSEPAYEETENIYKNNFKVTNTGTLESIISVNVDVNTNEFSDDVLMYKLYNDQGEVIEKDNFNGEGNKELVANIILPSNVTVEYTLMIWIKETGELQNDEMRKELEGTIKVDANQKID